MKSGNSVAGLRFILYPVAFAALRNDSVFIIITIFVFDILDYIFFLLQVSLQATVFYSLLATGSSVSLHSTLILNMVTYYKTSKQINVKRSMSLNCRIYLKGTTT